MPAVLPVPAVPAGVTRPLWSVMIPTYNCAGTLRETLESVLAQDPGPERMQIEVVDDCSERDDPEAVVAAVGRGRVGFFRQPRNVGHVANFNTCLERSRGELVHLLHGDDCVRGGFYAVMARGFAARADVGAAFCRHVLMDERGHWRTVTRLERTEPGVLEGWLDKLALGQRLQPPAVVVRRAVYERLGGFDARVRRYGEDWEMWVRIAAHYPVWYEPEPLAVYRMAAASLSGTAVRAGDDIRDCCRIVGITQGYLPGGPDPRLAARAREACALGAYRRLSRLLERGQLDALSPVQARAALRCSRAPRVWAQWSYLMLRWLWARAGAPRAA